MWYVLSCFTFLLVLSPFLSPETFLLLGAALYLPSCFGSRRLLLLTVICSFFLFAPTKSLNSFFSLTDLIIFVVFVRTIWTLRSRTAKGVSSREEILLCILLVAAAVSVMAVAVGGGDFQEGLKEFV